MNTMIRISLFRKAKGIQTPRVGARETLKTEGRELSGYLTDQFGPQ